MKSTWSMVTIVVVGPVAPACGAIQAAGSVVVVGCAELTVPVAGDAPRPAATRIPKAGGAPEFERAGNAPVVHGQSLSGPG
jgi:hypothetical protein